MPTINGTTPPPPPRPPKKSQPVKKVTQPTPPSRGALNNPDVMDESGSNWAWSNPKAPLPPRVKEYVATFHNLSVEDEGPLPAVTRKIQQNPELYQSLVDMVAEAPKAVGYMFSDDLTDDQKQRLAELNLVSKSLAEKSANSVNPSKDKLRATKQQVSESKEEIVKLLKMYGVNIDVTSLYLWSLAELQTVQGAVVKAANKLHKTVKSMYGDNAPNAAEVFKRIFSDDDGFNLVRTKSGFTGPNKNAYAYNYVKYDPVTGKRDGDIDLASNVFNTRLTSYEQSALARNKDRIFQRNPDWIPQFLILHEFAHNLDGQQPNGGSRTETVLLGYRRDGSRIPATAALYFNKMAVPNENGLTYEQKIKELIERAGTDPAKLDENSIATAGFKYVARSENDAYEYVADGIANWLMDSFTDDEYGKLRRQEMDEIMRRIIEFQFGPVT